MAAASLWADRLALLQQSDSQLRPLPNAICAWADWARKWIADEARAFLVAEDGPALLGFIIVAVMDGYPGLQPERLGILEAMAVDLHCAHPGLSGGLLARAKTWLRSQGIAVIEVRAPARYPVEEAFWQGQGAKLRSRTYWLNI